MSDDLISRKALLEEFDRVCVDGVMAHGVNVNLEIEFVRAVQKAPAVDPHKHGRWIWRQGTSDDEYYLICSRCKSTCHGYYDEEDEQYLFVRSRYCPNCGAKMDGGEER